MSTPTTNAVATTPAVNNLPDESVALFWSDVTRECPLRLSQTVHSYGRYVHYHDDSKPGKVFCLCHTYPVPEHLCLTPAQERAIRAVTEEERERGAAETVVD